MVEYRRIQKAQAGPGPAAVDDNKTMKTCPCCKREVEDDSVYCGYCDKKQPYVEPEPEEHGLSEEEGRPAAPAGWRCGNCGEELEANFDACWKCGAQKPAPEALPAAPAEPESPLLAVRAGDRRLEVYPRKVLVLPAGREGSAYIEPCEIGIPDIVSIEFTNAKDGAVGSMTVNYAAAPADDPGNFVRMSEEVRFPAEAGPEMAEALEVIKRCRMDLDAGR